MMNNGYGELDDQDDEPLPRRRARSEGPRLMSQGGDTNRWLIGIMGVVGAFVVTTVLGFQARVDARQDEVLKQVVELNAQIRQEQDRSTDMLAKALGDVAKSVADVSANDRGKR